MCINREPYSLDPRMGGELVSSSLHFLLFEGLTRFNADWTVSLSLAENVKISKDGKTYIFYLKSSYWSDGTPVTAYDFEYAWKKVLDPNFPALNAYLFFPIKNAASAKKGLIPIDDVGVKALNNNTLQVKLEHPTPYFLDLTAFSAFFPVPHAQEAQNPHWSRKIGEKFVCNGPFQLGRWDPRVAIEFERNPYYWNKEKINLDRIIVHIIVDGMTALNMYENNELDLIQVSLCPLPAETLQQLIKKGKLHLSPAAGSQIIVFNSEQFPFNHSKIRRAFSFAIQRQAIVENITRTGELPAFSAIPPVLKKGINESLIPEYDLELAQNLFTEALEELEIKKEDFPRITFLYSSSGSLGKIAEALQQHWQEAFGITVSLQTLEHIHFNDRLAKRNFQIAQTLWLAQYNDQMNFFERFRIKDSLKNCTGWENHKFSELLDRSLSESGNERMATLLEAEKLFLSEMPIAPLFHLNAAFLKKPHVKNLTSPYSSDLSYAQISYDQDP